MSDNRERYLATVTGTVAELERLEPERLETTVPGSPQWSVLDVLRHLSGVAADVVARRMDGAPGPAWTARHVDERRGQPAAEVLGGVVAAVAAVPPAVCDLRGANPYWDAVVHAADVREALGLAPLPDPLWRPVLADVLDIRSPRYDAGGQLTLHTESGAAVLGTGEPAVDARTSDYELFRAIFSRRSRAQVLAWSWDGDPGPHPAALPFFGERFDDQPVPSR